MTVRFPPEKDAYRTVHPETTEPSVEYPDLLQNFRINEMEYEKGNRHTGICDSYGEQLIHNIRNDLNRVVAQLMNNRISNE